jgi:hypothetical protein
MVSGGGNLRERVWGGLGMFVDVQAHSKAPEGRRTPNAAARTGTLGGREAPWESGSLLPLFRKRNLAATRVPDRETEIQEALRLPSKTICPVP